MAISETKGQGWKVKVILTQWRKASDILTSTLAAFLFSNQPKRERGREAHLNYYASTYNRGDNLCCSLTTLTTLILTAIFKVNSSLLCFLLYFPIHQVAPMCTPSNRPTCFFGPTRVHIPKEISVQPFWHCICVYVYYFYYFSLRTFPISVFSSLFSFCLTYVLPSRIWTRSVSRPEVIGGDRTWI